MTENLDKIIDQKKETAESRLAQLKGECNYSFKKPVLAGFYVKGEELKGLRQEKIKFSGGAYKDYSENQRTLVFEGEPTNDVMGLGKCIFYVPLEELEENEFQEVKKEDPR